MARTTVGAVKAVLAAGHDYDERRQPSLLPYVDIASSVVDDVVACAAARGSPLSAVKQELVERWLAAHYYKSSDQQYASKNTAGAGASFSGQTGKGIEGTKYGLAALDADPSGCLFEQAGHQVALGLWLGKAPSEAIPYRDRD